MAPITRETKIHKIQLYDYDTDDVNQEGAPINAKMMHTIIPDDPLQQMLLGSFELLNLTSLTKFNLEVKLFCSKFEILYVLSNNFVYQ